VKAGLAGAYDEDVHPAVLAPVFPGR